MYGLCEDNVARGLQDSVEFPQGEMIQYLLIQCLW